MNTFVRPLVGMLLGSTFFIATASANALVGEMYDYESIGRSFSHQVDKILKFESRLNAIKSNKVAFLDQQQIDRVNRVLRHIRQLKQVHNKLHKGNYYSVGREIVDASLGNPNCEVHTIALAAAKTIQVSCTGLGYDIDSDTYYSEYAYSDFFMTEKQGSGRVVVTSFIDGRLSHLEEQIIAVDDEMARVYAPYLHDKQRTYKTP